MVDSAKKETKAKKTTKTAQSSQPKAAKTVKKSAAAKTTKKAAVESTKVEKKDMIRIKLRSYDHRSIDSSVSMIVETVKRAGAVIKGPMPMPVRRERITILKSPHVNKDARNQYELRTHTRVLFILQPDAATIDALMKLNLSSGIDILITVDGEK